MKNINTEHPFWSLHLQKLIEEKWEKRDKQLTHSFTVIRMRDDSSDEELEENAKIFIENYLKDKIDQIDNFSIFSRYTETPNRNLVIDVRMVVKLFVHSA